MAVCVRVRSSLPVHEYKREEPVPMEVWTRLPCHTFRAHMTYVYGVFRKYSQLL
jgi:hypothetical protein